MCPNGAQQPQTVNNLRLKKFKVRVFVKNEVKLEILHLFSAAMSEEKIADDLI